MLKIPTKGFPVSIHEHRINLDDFADWIEGSVAFHQDTISQTDIVDCLIEDGIYREQGFAKIHISNVFVELERRAKCLGRTSPFTIDRLKVKRVVQWKDAPAYSFCLMLSLLVSYRSEFRNSLGESYNEQGALFERLTSETLEKCGWTTLSTGWSAITANSLEAKVKSVAEHINEPVSARGIERWTPEYAKDLGLDLVCHAPFADRWPGRPLYYVQCASGENWKDKRHTPIIREWEKVLDMATRPTRGIAIPFALLEDDFRRSANFEDLSLVLDRHRVCAPNNQLPTNWITTALATDLNAWTDARVAVIPLN